MVIDLERSLTPEELTNFEDHPVVQAAAVAMINQPAMAVEAAKVCEEIIFALEGYDVLAAIIGCLDALGVLIANLEYQAERKEMKQKLRVVK